MCWVTCRRLVSSILWYYLLQARIKTCLSEREHQTIKRCEVFKRSVVSNKTLRTREKVRFRRPATFILRCFLFVITVAIVLPLAFLLFFGPYDKDRDAVMADGDGGHVTLDGSKSIPEQLH